MASQNKSTKLNERQEKFCQHYATWNNATKAALHAGYSEKTARVKASQLLTKVNIKNRIAELIEPVIEKMGIERNFIHSKWYNALTIDLADVNDRIVYKGLNQPDLSDLTAEERSCITGLKPTANGWQVEFISKEKALVELSKLLKLVKDTHTDVNVFLNGLELSRSTDDLKEVDMITSESEMEAKYG
ncbi:MAG: terminase small subunit [Bacteroidota bacterium]